MRLVLNVYISWLSILENPLKHWISLFLHQLCHPSKCKKTRIYNVKFTFSHLTQVMKKQTPEQ